MGKFNYIYKTKFRKMGKWNLLPADTTGAWHSLETSKYFKKIFGFGKGTFIIQTLDDDMQHCYFPQFYIDKIYNFIRDTNRQNYKKLARTISTFYSLRKVAKKQIPKIAKLNLARLSNKDLARVYLANRDWAHKMTPYDQFGWIAEDYWNPVLEKILVAQGLQKGSAEFHRVLFALTKPEEISTTLSEKRDVLRQAIRIKEKKISIEAAARRLAKNYGWMPVFVFGKPWDKEHYLLELEGTSKKGIADLREEVRRLNDYRKIRSEEIRVIQQKYNFKPQDLQKFIDFGLVLDARNEAEYLLSFCSLYLLPIYDEIARRLFVSVKQLRNLVKKDIVACLQGKADPQRLLQSQGKITGWIFDKTMMHMKYLAEREARKFFDYLNKTSRNLQGNNEVRGICANPGKAKGRAKIMLYPSDDYKVKNGDILIAHATTVDYSMAMKRSAAFVTEIGGLMCHAAVVAREFGVPCIVGLRDATKNFKDGEMVEVDADKGVVRKFFN